MVKVTKPMKAWKFCNLRSDDEREGVLMAYWEVSLDPMSDDYTPEEISACELFKQWIQKVRNKYPKNLIPIHWPVECTAQAVFEYMPFQFEHLTKRRNEDFLTFFTWPLNSATGERLNWLTLPVVDKLWNSKQADKGGFIQEATGWEPAILQPYIYLPSLSSILRVC
jgi:hypothetical protein